MATLLSMESNRIIVAESFDSAEGNIYKETNSVPEELLFTRTLASQSLIFRETEQGRLLSSASDFAQRSSLAPDVPIQGPFIPSYSHTGSLQNEDFINLLLIDKPPLRTGFFQFTVNNTSFPGFITKFTEYEHWNWEEYFGTYAYVRQPTNLGYGIEISNNVLYTATYSAAQGRYIYTPTETYNLLASLTGTEEIVSAATTIDPNTYTNPVQGDIVDSADSLPISLFYISPADALRYIASYPDLIQQFGADFEQGQIHYAQNSRKITFNPISYLNSYPDVRTLYGYDTYGATVHYITIGYAEGRTWEGGSSFSTLTGGLYDERYGGFGLTDESFIWANGKTLSNNDRVLAYKFNGINYYINGDVPFTEQLAYLRRQ